MVMTEKEIKLKNMRRQKYPSNFIKFIQKFNLWKEIKVKPKKGKAR